jgi:hypothetical protein
VRTDIAGFVGFAERGPLPPPVNDVNFDPASVALRLTSWKEYQAHFGGFSRYGYLAYAVRAFFENGGMECYVVRVAAITAANEQDRPSAALLTVPGSAPAPLPGVTLSDDVPAGSNTIPLSTAADLAPGDYVSLSANGLQDTATVVSLNGLSAILSRQLHASYAKDTPVARAASSCYFLARSAGNWGNRLRLRITPLDAQFFALRVTLEPGDDIQPIEEEFYTRITLITGDSKSYAPDVLRDRSNLVDCFTSANSNNQVLAGAVVQDLILSGGRDGVSTVTQFDFTGAPDDMRGLRLLEGIDAVAILCVPDAVFLQPPDSLPPTAQPDDPCHPVVQKSDAPPPPPDPTCKPALISDPARLFIQNSMIEQCERLRDRIAILDPPPDLQPVQMQLWPGQQQLRNPMGKFGALYYPWLKVPDALSVSGPNRAVPPCGHVAGIYARTDHTFGVQKPPANEELEFAADTVLSISDLQQESLNDLRVNCLRSLPGRGIRVWGARSLSTGAQWKFIHTRRLMSMTEESIDKSTRWTVFELNNEALRRTLVHSLNVFLEGIWRRGGLKGTTTAQAYYVRCDETNNPQPVIDQGQLICQVGIAVAAPMEFLVFEIRRTVAGSEVVEA